MGGAGPGTLSGREQIPAARGRAGRAPVGRAQGTLGAGGSPLHCDSLVTGRHECVKTKRTVHSECMNTSICKLHPNKAD